MIEKLYVKVGLHVTPAGRLIQDAFSSTCPFWSENESVLIKFNVQKSLNLQELLRKHSKV